MNLPYIQAEIFRELVGMETLFKPEYRFTIYRSFTKIIMFVDLWDSEEEQIIPTHYINTHAIETAADITAEINRIWHAIPDECKKDNIVK